MAYDKAFESRFVSPLIAYLGAFKVSMEIGGTLEAMKEALRALRDGAGLAWLAGVSTTDKLTKMSEAERLPHRPASYPKQSILGSTTIRFWEYASRKIRSQRHSGLK